MLISLISLRPMLPCLLGAFIVMLCLPRASIASCGSASTHKEQEDLSWVKSNKQIYIAKDGKIFQTKFNNNQFNQLADHGFDYISSFKLSPNMKYIYYQGYAQERGFQDFLYDINLKRDFALNLSDYNLSGANLNSIEFSPDGSKLAWVMNASKLVSHKIVIKDLVQSKETVVDYILEPNSTKDYRMTELKWALGSDALFLGTTAYPDHAYYKYTLATKQLMKIDGRFHPFKNYKDLEDYGFHFIVNGQEQPYYKPYCLQSQCHEQGTAKPEFSAEIDSGYNLVLIKSGQKKVIDKGSYNQCEGVTIRILSWLENGSYLVYQKSGSTHIYGLAEDKSAKLFDAGDFGFGWEDYENRKQRNFQ